MDETSETINRNKAEILARQYKMYLQLHFLSGIRESLNALILI